MLIEHSVTFSQGPKVRLRLDKEKECFRATLLESEIFTFSFPKGPLPPWIHGISIWMEAYSKRKTLPPLLLPRQILPSFSEKVLHKMSQIPMGKTLSYGDLALQSGSPRASRAVGTICRLNHWPLLIPCHRVIAKTGSIGNYAFGIPIKRLLLEFESTT